MSTLNVTNIKAADGTSGLTIANSTGIVTATKGVNSVAFAVEATNTDQTGSTGKVQWEDVRLDTGNYWSTSNHRFTPQVAGWYMFGGIVRVSTTAGEGSPNNLLAFMIYKNGSQYTRSQLQFNSDVYINGSYPIPNSMVQLNGSSDYIELYFETDESVQLHDAGNTPSQFWGMLVQAT